MKSPLCQLLLAGVLLFGMSAYSWACPDIFVEAYGGSPDEVANCVIATQDGGIVITGYYGGGGSSGKGVLLAKFDSQGDLLWKRAYSGPEDEEGCGVVETHDGYLVMVGYTRSYTAGQADFLMGKFDAEGNRIWMRTWGESGNEKAFGVIEASDQTLWLAGFSTSFNGSGKEEVVVARIAADGGIITGGYAGNPGLSRKYLGYALAEVFDTAGICVAGSIYNSVYGWDILLAKFSHSGEVLWAKGIHNDDHSPSSEHATGFVRTSDGGLALVGPVNYYDGVYTSNGGFLLKMDTNAEVHWGRFVHGGGPYYSRTLTSVIETDDADLVVTGGDFGNYMYDDRVVLAKYNLSGTLQWNWGHEIGDGGIGNSIAEDSDHSLLMAGSTAGYGLGGDDMLLGRYDSTGMTCLPNVDGPSFTSWSPTERNIYPSSGQFTETTSNWSHYVIPYYMAVTEICPQTYTVCPDGSGDFERIQDALDGAPLGSTIELCDAVYSGPGNYDLDFNGKCLTVRSQNGDPNSCIIDCAGAGRGFYFHSGEDEDSIIENVTITNGYDNYGGGIYCSNASPTITGCVIAGNSANYNGGGMRIRYSSATLTGCVITGNRGGNDGGGLYLSDSSALLYNCTISGNLAMDQGGGIFGGCHPENTIIWGNCAENDGEDGDEWYGNGANWVEDCCNDINLAGVDGFGIMTVYCTWGADIDADPLFCDPRSCQAAPTAAGDYHLQPASPCLPEQQPICGLIGALDACPADPSGIDNPLTEETPAFYEHNVPPSITDSQLHKPQP
ncbi:MAG: hypothetical protein KAY37_15680 [Phycisphaerae bacterium]|nr:hypothetical protein [Phycisphaerae bacterium]